MLKKIKRRFCKYIAHLLSPDIVTELDKIHQNDYKWIKSQFMYCGKDVTIGEAASIGGMKYISIGNNFYAGRHFRLEAIDSYENDRFTPQLEIGNDVSVQDFCHIGCIERVSIGDGTLIASKVFITDHFHGFINKSDLVAAPAKRPLSHKSVKIGKNVWIGDGACILPGVSLGDNVIVGANAVVTHNFPSNSVIAGCPAKIIKIIE